MTIADLSETSSKTDQESSLLGKLSIGAKGIEAAPIPDLVYDLQRWFEGQKIGAAAFILPAPFELPLHVAISMALDLARTGFERRVESHFQTGFQKGERIAVRPQGHIYQYDGYFNLPTDMDAASKRFLILKLIDDKGNGKVSFPESEIARLEHTERSTPIGRRGISLEPFRKTPLDLLLGTSSGGNNNFFETGVFIVTSPAKFEHYVTDTVVSRSDQHHLREVPTSHFLPWGKLRSDGSVSLAGESDTKGHPLIAVTARLSPLLEYLETNRSAAPYILFDGPAFAQHDPTVFSEIARRSRLAILAGFRDVPALRILANQCSMKMYQLPPERLLSERSGYRGVFQQALNAATNAVQFERIDIHRVSSEELENISKELDGFRRCIGEDDITPDQTEFLRTLFRFLLQMSNNLCRTEHSSLVSNFEALSRAFVKQRRYWPTQAADSLNNVLIGMGGALTSSTPPGLAKRLAIESHINRKLTEEECKQYTIHVQVDEELVTLLPGWPGRRRLEDTVYRFDSKTMVSFCFDFEIPWFESFNKKYRDVELYATTATRPYRPSEASAGQIYSPPEKNGPLPSPHAEDASVEELLDRIPVTAGDSNNDPDVDVVEAVFVDFADGRYAYITPDHKVPVILAFGQFEGTTYARVERFTPDNLDVGHLCAFRHGADGDAVQLFAERRIGEGKYRLLREIATSWRVPLRAAGRTLDDIVNRLREVGYDGNSQTVRNWLRNPNLIGPADRSTLEMIQRVSGQSTDTREIDKIWNAMGKIRGTHIQAGSDLTKALLSELPAKITKEGNYTGTFSLTFGELDLVEVSGVNRKTSLISLDKTNRVLGGHAF